MFRRTNTGNMPRNCGHTDGASKHNFIRQSIWRLNKNLSSKCALFSVSDGCLLKLKKYSGSVHKVMNFSEKIRQQSSVLFVPLVIGVMLVMSVSVSVSKSPSCKFDLLLHIFLLVVYKIFKDSVCYFIFHRNTYFHCAGALTEENLLFLEAWRTIDRAYVDKSFNGQSWFRYREDALRNEPMNTREQTCMDSNLIII